MTPIRRLLLVAVVLALALAGCGSSESDEPRSGGSTTETTAAQGSFPARATHRFGTTVVPRQPERIVIVGLTEQDTVLALGHRPIATTEWYGRRPGAIWPWAREAMGRATPRC